MSKTSPALHAIRNNAPMQKPWAEMSEPEKLTANAIIALEKIRDTLQLRIDPSNPRTMAIILNAALGVLAIKVKVDETGLRDAGPVVDSYESMLARLGKQGEPK